MRKRSRIQFLGWMLCLVCGLAGCTGPQVSESSRQETESTESDHESEQESSRDETLPEAQEGGMLSMAVVNPDHFNPLLCTQEEVVQMMNLLFRPLLKVGAGGEIRPSIAREWQWEGNTLTLTIDTEILYHDGSRVSVEDVVYSIALIQENPQSYYYSCVEQVTQVKTSGGNKVVLTFADDGEHQMELLYFPVISRSYYRNAEAQKTPMGNGPYKVADHLARRELQLVRFEDYGETKPYISEVTVYLCRVQEAVDTAFETGKTNLYYPVDTQWGYDANRSNLTLHAYDSVERIELLFNCSNGFFGQATRRLGAVLCVNSGEVLQQAYWGKGIVSEEILAPGGLLGAAGQGIGYDLARGQNLLDAFGEESLTILLETGDDVAAKAAGVVVKQLAAAGMTCEIKAQSAEELEQIQREGQWDIWVRRQEAHWSAVEEQLAASGYTAVEVNQLYSSDAATILEVLQQKITEEVPVYPLFYLTRTMMTGRSVYGQLEPLAHNLYNGIENLYIVETE